MYARIPTVALLTVAATLLVAPRPAEPQATGSPSEFLRALAQSGVIGVFDDSVSVLEGRIPAKWAAMLPVPPAARVLGTVFDSSAATAYVVVRATAEAAATLVESVAASKGWVARRPTFYPARPFVQQSQLRGPSQYCRGRREQLVVAPHAVADGALVQLMYMTGSGFACEDEGAANPRARVLPSLEPPPMPKGALPTDCPAGGRSSSTTGASLVTDAAPAAVLAGYGRQLEAAGWRPMEAAAAPAFGAWSRTAAGGGTDRVVLVVTPESGGRGPCRSVSITLEQRP